MRNARWIIAMFFMAGCQKPSSPKVDSPPTVPMPEPTTISSSPKSTVPLPEPTTFSSWPKITYKPVHVGPKLWALCRMPSPAEEKRRKEEAESQGPHAGSIVVRVSPGVLEDYLDNKPLPVGASVIKEKYKDGVNELSEYAVMVKREAGYDPSGGDWEYGYVTPERKVTRGKLVECAGCHASAKASDYLFRSYGERAVNGPIPEFVAFLKRNGIVLKRIPGEMGDWRVEGHPAGPNYEVVVSFRTFPADFTVEQMEMELMPISLPYRLNGPARLAMSFPNFQELPGSDGKPVPDMETLPVNKELFRLFKSYKSR
jgi:hypothetical protein